MRRFSSKISAGAPNVEAGECVSLLPSSEMEFREMIKTKWDRYTVTMSSYFSSYNRSLRSASIHLLSSVWNLHLPTDLRTALIPTGSGIYMKWTRADFQNCFIIEAGCCVICYLSPFLSSANDIIRLLLLALSCDLKRFCLSGSNHRGSWHQPLPLWWRLCADIAARLW